MPDQHEYLSPQDLAEVRMRADRFDKALHGASDDEAVVSAMASAGDVRPLLAEVEALRRENAELRTGSLHQLVASVPSGELRNRLADLAAEIELELIQEGAGTDG